MCCLPVLVPVIEMAAQMQGHDGVDAAQWIYFKIDEITTETSLVSWASIEVLNRVASDHN